MNQEGDPLDSHCSELSDGSDKNAFAGLRCRVTAQRYERPELCFDYRRKICRYSSFFFEY
jgi:hypothetical protein